MINESFAYPGEGAVGIEDMSSYERAAWDDVVRWQVGRLADAERAARRGKARDRLARASEFGREKLDAIPGSQQLAATLTKAVDGMLTMVNKAAEKTVRRDAVVDAYAKRGHTVTDIADIRRLDLEDIDKVKPRLDLRYASGTAVTGAVTGLAVSGGEILATVGTVASAGAAAAPGAGTVVGALAADAVAVLGAMTRAVARTAAFYGYDTDLPQERIFALGVLNFGLAQQTGKSAAYIELNKIVQALARNVSWAQLNKNSVTRVIHVVYQRLGMNLTKRKLGQAVPVVGIVLGAGLNARMLAKLIDDADRLYRERFLRDKHNISDTDVEMPLDTNRDTNDEILIAEIVDDELTTDPFDHGSVEHR